MPWLADLVGGGEVAGVFLIEDVMVAEGLKDAKDVDGTLG
jgi:hypothetical protein